MNVVTEVYVLFLMTVFPLIMHDKYYDISEAKLYAYLYATMAAAAAAFLVGVLALVEEMSQYKGQHLKAFFWKLKTFKGLKEVFLPSDVFALLFLVAAIISTLCSEWVYEAFWGSMGRQQGLFLYLWYAFSYVLISRFYRMKQWHLDLFLAAGAVVCVWGVLDYFCKSPIGWQQNVKKDQVYDFSSTIGNVNILTGLEGIYLLVSSALWIGMQKPAAKTYYGRLALYFGMSVISFMGLTCGCSDNALLSVGTAVCFLPFFAFGSRKGIARYWAMLTGFIGSLLLVGTLTAREGQRVIPKSKWGELLKLANKQTALLWKMLPAAIAILAALIVWAVMMDRKEKDVFWKPSRYLRILWAALGVLAAAGIGYILHDANTGGHPELYKAYSSLLIFNDDWGTHRGYNWRLLLTHIGKFSFFKKLFGSGPETYGIYTIKYNLYAMLDTYDEVYDSPHNEFLQYLFNNGILGFIGYYGMIVSTLISGFGGKMLKAAVTAASGNAAADRVPAENTSAAANTSGAADNISVSKIRLCTIACAYGILAYTVQSFFNISVALTVPVVVMLVSMIASVEKAARRTAQEAKAAAEE